MGRCLCKPRHGGVNGDAQLAELFQLTLADLLAHALQPAQHRQLGELLRRDTALERRFRQLDEAEYQLSIAVCRCGEQ